MNTYHHSIRKKPINADYSTLSEEFDSIHKAPKFKAGDRVRITNYKIILAKAVFFSKGCH